jgi:hypothetical protein
LQPVVVMPVVAVGYGERFVESDPGDLAALLRVDRKS